MHVGIANYIAVSFEVCGGENVPGIPCACARRNFTYVVRGLGPCSAIFISSLSWGCTGGRVTSRDRREYGDRGLPLRVTRRLPQASASLSTSTTTEGGIGGYRGSLFKGTGPTGCTGTTPPWRHSVPTLPEVVLTWISPEFTGHRWIPRTKVSDAELWCFFYLRLNKPLRKNNREAGDLKRHRAHYDVIVMKWLGIEYCCC